jgi:transposase
MVEFSSMKKRSKEEVETILREFAQGMSLVEICKKYDMSDSAFYRLLAASKGLDPNAYRKKSESKIAKLEKALEKREKEIRLLKMVLKKT